MPIGWYSLPLTCELLATDQSVDAAIDGGWDTSNQFAGQIDAMNDKGLCENDLFRKRVLFRTVDMRDIPPDLKYFDFTWSSCAFEHLGSIEAGIDFIIKQMDCLRPGRIAVHTTEFNISSNTNTVAMGPTVLFRRRDLETLARQLRSRGDHIISTSHSARPNKTRM